MKETDDRLQDADTALYNDVYREISAWLGREAAIKLYDMFKGQQISFPVRLYDPEAVRLAVLREYDGTNVAQLAKKYGYSEKTVRRMLSSQKDFE